MQDLFQDTEVHDKEVVDRNQNNSIEVRTYSGTNSIELRNVCNCSRCVYVLWFCQLTSLGPSIRRGVVVEDHVMGGTIITSCKVRNTVTVKVLLSWKRTLHPNLKVSKIKKSIYQRHELNSEE